MKNVILFLTFLVSIPYSLSQTRVVGTDYTSFRIEQENDTIDFVIADTVLNVKKPLLLFCQGSLPVPLFVDFGNHRIAPLQFGNFDLENMKKHYHVAVISMPKTPLVPKIEELSEQYFYIGNSGRRNPTDEFSLADYLENYVRRANTVIEFMMNEDYVDTSKIVVFGHSQGSRVAVALADDNEHVTHLGLSAYSYEPRMHEILRRIRVRAEKGEITWEEADSLQANRYAFYARVHNDDSLKARPHLTSWRSFSKSSLHELAGLKIPVYIVYGSEDIGCVNSDMIPLYFIEQGKMNYVVKRYPGLEHNFFPLVDGKPDYKNGEWKNVMNAFIEWSLGD
ncbi:alpha/beta fold hydrolase [Brumimicrobium sp.]|uniref:alpha/beta fold hydrolase n=1 Tax=Brumimicrobium sp. TaxID=2029867 RepID=UPI003A8E60D7